MEQNKNSKISLEVSVGLDDVQNNEMILGKSYGEWTDEQKIDFVYQTAKTSKEPKIVTNDKKKTSYEIKGSFMTSDPKVEYMRELGRSALRDVLGFAGIVFGPALVSNAAAAGSGDFNSWVAGLTGVVMFGLGMATLSNSNMII